MVCGSFFLNEITLFDQLEIFSINSVIGDEFERAKVSSVTRRVGILHSELLVLSHDAAQMRIHREGNHLLR